VNSLLAYARGLAYHPSLCVIMQKQFATMLKHLIGLYPLTVVLELAMLNPT